MTEQEPLRVLVVDDTALYRKVVGEILAELPRVEVVGTAYNGKDALSKIGSLKPDLLTLDIRMPEMDGLEVLTQIRKESLDVGAIMLSCYTRRESEMTLRALELGAFDFIPKPETGNMEQNREGIKTALSPMLAAFARQRSIRRLLTGRPGPAVPQAADRAAPAAAATPGIRRQRPGSRIVAIGVSTGGPAALSRMMPRIPGDLGVPILIVQHMPPVFTEALARNLNSLCSYNVKEASNGEPLRPDTAFVAPGGRQMKVVKDRNTGADVLRISDDPPVNNCRPSADYLFCFLAESHGENATGVIMTGMGADGAAGLKRMKQNGAYVIAQDEASCVVYGMSKAVVNDGTADEVVPLDAMAEAIRLSVKPVRKSRDRDG